MRENNLVIGTIREIAAESAKSIKYGARRWQFIDFDFALADIEIEDVGSINDLTDFAFRCEGWYGIKYVDTDFDSCDLTLIGDYYGGSCMCCQQIYEGMSDEEVKEAIASLILNVLDFNGIGASENTVIVMEGKIVPIEVQE